MKLKNIKLGNLTLKNNVFLAPMAGYTDFAFRSVAYKQGAGLCVSEMVSAKGLMYKNENTCKLLQTAKNEYVKCVQIFGNDPYVMRSACESDYLEKFDVIDINMGCPVSKIYNNGEGSSLMNDFSLASKIISECCKSNKIITVKFRAGIYENNLLACEFAKMCEQSGAKLVTIHGRTREGMYSGKVHYDEILKSKKAVKIPVIANGNLFSVEDCNDMIDKTGADGVAIARGGVCNPQIFSQLCSEQPFTKKQILFDIIDLRLQFEDDFHVACAMRATLAQAVKGIRDSKNAKLNIFKAQSTNQIKQILNDVM